MRKKKNNSMSENTPFDDVFRTLLEKCTKLIIPVINEVFHTSYDMNEPVKILANEHYVYVNGRRQKRITDSCVLLRNYEYHMECESKSKKNVVIRMMEYDFTIALQNIRNDNGQYSMEFPHSAVVYIRKADNIPEELTISVKLADGQQVKYAVPTVKINTYTKEEIFDKNLLFFLPYYILRFEQDINEIDKDDEKRKELAEDYKDIYQRLCTMQDAEQLDGDYLFNLVELINRLIGVVAEDADNVKDEVMNMGGRVLELESDRIREEMNREIRKGKLEGRREGKLEGRQEAIAMMVMNMSENNMSTQEIAAISRLSVSEVEKILSKKK